MKGKIYKTIRAFINDCEWSYDFDEQDGAFLTGNPCFRLKYKKELVAFYRLHEGHDYFDHNLVKKYVKGFKNDYWVDIHAKAYPIIFDRKYDDKFYAF